MYKDTVAACVRSTLAPRRPVMVLQRLAVDQFHPADRADPVLAVASQVQPVQGRLRLPPRRGLTGRTWLHGSRAGRMVHVGSVEAPVTVGDIKNIATEFKKTMGSGKDAPKTNSIDVLGWDFAFELNE